LPFGDRRPPADDFFVPHVDMRNKRTGCAVSIGEDRRNLAGLSAGPMRAPLIERAAMRTARPLIKPFGPQ
jgi:hypothetical protein